MSIIWIFAIIAFVGTFFACTLLALSLFEKVQNLQDTQRLNLRLREGSLGKTEAIGQVGDDFGRSSNRQVAAKLRFWQRPIVSVPVSWEVQGAFSDAASQQMICSAICSRFELGKRLLHLLNQADMDRQREALLQWWLAVVGMAVLCALLVSSLMMAVVLVILALVLSIVYLQALADKRRQALRSALPDMLDELAQSLRAGRSFPQSLSFVSNAQSADSPIKDILRRLDADARLGRSCAESLKELSLKAELRELKSIAAVLEIATRIGGGTPSLFEQAATSIRQDLMLNKKLKVQTAQGRSSVRLIGIVPFVLIGFMSLVMPGYLGLWLNSPGGQFLFGLAMCLLAIGFFWVRSVVNIRV
ncbi:MAG: type II secretion system F family protein [Coriobacteriia bacterium]|nr:type II secretion system F family protein [Coriobacteriia bacterium]